MVSARPRKTLPSKQAQQKPAARRKPRKKVGAASLIARPQPDAQEVTTQSFPAWNYWQFDETGEPLYGLLYGFEFDYGDDLRRASFDADSEWYDRWFWTSSEAAALLYDRDPKEFPWGGQWDSYNKPESYQLLNTILALRDAIEADQSKGVLPPEFIPTEMILEWALRKRMPCPPYLHNAIERRREKNAVNVVGEQHQPSGDHSEGGPVLSTKAAEPSVEVAPKPTGPETRAENTLLKIIWALGEGRDRSALVRTIATRLERRADEVGNSRLQVGDETIRKKLSAADSIAS